MRHLFSVAARNLLRNKRRTLLAALAVVIGVGAATFMRGMINGFVVAGLDDAVYGRIGAIQIHKAGYKRADADLLEYDLPDDPAFAAKIAAVPGVAAITPRLFFEGMLSNGSVSTMYMATAIDPRTEYRVCPKRKENVTAGGVTLDETMADGAVVGATIASFLDARPGSTLTATATTKTGQPNALDLTVRGTLQARFIFESKRVITVPFAWARSLLRMEGRLSYYALDVIDLGQVDIVADRIRAAIGPDYQVDTWKDLDVNLRERTERVGYVLGIIVIILALLVGTTVLNTMLMTVYERVREIGTMMAVGVRRRQVMVMFLVEAAVLGLAGSVVGAAIAFGWVRWLAATGVMFRPPGGEPMKVVPFVEPRFLVAAVVLAGVATVLAGLLPAWKASRLSPVEALRSN